MDFDARTREPQPGVRLRAHAQAPDRYVDKIGEIRSVAAKPRIILECGQNIPLSRGYGEEFSAAISGRSG